jgi:hypothetical protein
MTMTQGRANFRVVFSDRRCGGGWQARGVARPTAVVSACVCWMDLLRGGKIEQQANMASRDGVDTRPKKKGVEPGGLRKASSGTGRLQYSFFPYFRIAVLGDHCFRRRPCSRGPIVSYDTTLALRCIPGVNLCVRAHLFVSLGVVAAAAAVVGPHFGACLSDGRPMRPFLWCVPPLPSALSLHGVFRSS